MNDADLRRWDALDARLVEAAKPIKILSNLNWPASVAEAFLRSWQAGAPTLPRVEYTKFDFAASVAALKTIAAECDASHPVAAYIRRTAGSYVTAARMLENIGAPAFTQLSAEIYGRPSDRLVDGGPTNLEAADQFLKATEDLAELCARPDQDVSLTPEEVAGVLRERLASVFKDHPIEVGVDPGLAAKAAAGARRLRLRGSTRFHPFDVGQLVQHEAFVHSATMLNGRQQPHLKSLGLGAPRTSRTQEGLATFAELITTTMDLGRLRRIALRPRAVHMALDGADFIDIVRFHVDAGQNVQDAFQSARRIFRGGDARGRIVFTRDVVYVQGLMFTHTFLLKAIQARRPDFAGHLFSGRLSWGDVLALDPFFASGYIAAPLYRPEWVANIGPLAAYLTYAIFANRIHLGAIELDHFRAQEA